MERHHTSAPNLSRAEWQAVSVALAEAGRRGCGAPGGSVLASLGRLAAKLTGTASVRPLADPRVEAVRRFVCETGRDRRPAERLFPTLVAQGFNRPQIEALGLLSL